VRQITHDDRPSNQRLAGSVKQARSEATWRLVYLKQQLSYVADATPSCYLLVLCTAVNQSRADLQHPSNTAVKIIIYYNRLLNVRL